MKNKKKSKSKFKKEHIQISVLILIVLLAVIFLNPVKPASEGVQLRYVPLSQEEVQKAATTILSTEFIQDVPNEDPIALIFYSYEGDEMVQRDGFLIGENELLTSGTPSLYIYAPARYIPEFDGTNLCEIIQLASRNGELIINSEYGNARLLLKYSGLLKYRDCFGF
jgi:hypothetical protein